MGTPRHLEGRLDADGRLNCDVPCLSCGYNLRGLPTEGKCPECGAAVEPSLDPALLIWSDAKWLAGLARGIKWILLGLYAGGAAFVMLLLVVSLLAQRSLLSQWTGPLVTWLLGMPPGLAIWWGCWLLTRPDPYPPRWIEPSVARSLARACATTVAVLAALSLPAAVSPSALTGVLLLAVIAVTVAGFAALNHGRALARRIPDRRLSGNVKVLARAYGLATAFLGLIVIMFAPMRGHIPPSVLPLILLAVLGLWASLMLLGAWTLVLFAWFHRRFRKLAALAAGKG